MIINALKTYMNSLTKDVRNNTINGLDGLRGIAALIVVMGHYSIYSQYWVSQIAPFAKHGVWLFFILSSFLLSFLFMKSLDNHNFKDVLKRYIPRRFLRIFPMYYACLLLLVLSPNFYRMMFGGADKLIIDQALLIFPGGIFWSISAEFEFYFFLPIFVFLNFILKSLRARLCYQILIFISACLLSLYLNTIYFPANYPHVFFYLPIFMTGLALGLFYAEISSKQIKKINVNIAMLFGVLGLIGLITTIPGIGFWISRQVGTEIWYHFLARPFQVSCSWAMLLFAVLQGPKIFYKILDYPLFRLMGIVSFSVYLNHIFVMAIFSAWALPYLGFYLTFLFTLLIIYLMSIITYILIERPFMRIKIFKAKIL